MVRPSCAGKRLGLLALSATLAIALAAPAAGNAAAKRATVNFKTVVVGAAGNPSVGIVPFTDAIYQSCDGARRPAASPSAASITRTGSASSR